MGEAAAKALARESLLAAMKKVADGTAGVLPDGCHLVLVGFSPHGIVCPMSSAGVDGGIAILEAGLKVLRDGTARQGDYTTGTSQQ